jgi:hypothetical protein
MDIDTILYIVLIIIMLVVSGISSRRKKQAQQMKKPVPGTGPQGTEGPGVTGTQARTPAVDPFERLEQILTGRPAYESFEGESLEVLQDEEDIPVDEEEMMAESPPVERKAVKVVPRKEDEEEEIPSYPEGLFRDMDEITKAVIYSEIFPRKYK